MKCKKNILKSLLLVIVMLIVSLPIVPEMNADAASYKIRYHFIDTTGSGGGDATLIDANGRYYLVDGGPNRGYTNLKNYLLKHCTKKYDGKIEIQVAIVTHNHTDHYKGIMHMLNDTSTFRVKRVIKSFVEPVAELNTACKNAGTVDTLKTGEIVKLAKFNDSQITIYGPSRPIEGLGGKESTKVNNLSMIVRVDAAQNLIIMGDLYERGFEFALEKYGTALFNGNYQFCKVGHHGVRNGGDDGNQNIDKLNKEIGMYRTYVNSDVYVFTAANDTIADVTYKNNYNRFKIGLKAVIEETRRGSIRWTVTNSTTANATYY